MSLEFPVSQDTLTRLILNNDVESDIFKVNIISVQLMLVSLENVVLMVFVVLFNWLGDCVMCLTSRLQL